MLEIAEAYSGPIVREVPPESVEPESVQPESIQPESIQPESIQPESIQPESVEPESVEPVAAERVEPVEEAVPVVIPAPVPVQLPVAPAPAATPAPAPAPVAKAEVSEPPHRPAPAPSLPSAAPPTAPKPEILPQAEPVPATQLAPAPDIALLRGPAIAQVGAPLDDDELPSAPKRSKAALALLLAAVLGGAALEMTPYGAFGRIFIGDKLHADEYAQMAVSASDKARAKMRTDIFPDAASAREELGRLVADAPRAKELVAYRALFDAAAQLRFGPFEPADVDEARALLGSMPPALAGSEEALVLRGEVALATGAAKEAVASFEQARAKQPSARAHFGLARAHLATGDVEASRKDVEAALAVSPRHAGARVFRAGIAWLRERNDGGMEDLSAVFDGAAKDAASPLELGRAWALAGLIEANWGRTGEARSAFEQALKLDPRSAEAFVGQGELAFADGHTSEAIASFEQALTIVPGFPDAVTSAAKAKLAGDRAADAHTQLAAARKDHPKDFRIAYWLAKSDEALGNAEVAEHEYTEAIALADPAAKDASLPWAGLVQFLVVTGRPDDAQAKLEEAKSKLGDAAPVERALGEGYRQRGLAARKRGAIGEAIAGLSRAAEIDPGRSDIYADLADCYEAKNDSQSAFLSWQKALKGNDTQIYWRYRFGRLLLERGTVSEAAKHLVFAVDAAKWTNPLPAWFVAAELACAEALQKAGKFPDAIAYYKDYLERAPKTAPERKSALAERAKLGAPVKDSP